jgi:hypothetical protein
MHSPDRLSRTQDEWIVLRCQAGETSAFEDLVRLMQRPLLHYATKLTGNAETTLDVLQGVDLPRSSSRHKLAVRVCCASVCSRIGVMETTGGGALVAAENGAGSNFRQGSTSECFVSRDV